MYQNPLLSGVPQQPQQTLDFSGFRQVLGMFNMSQNKTETLNLIAQRNPKMQQIMQMCSGKNPREVFIAECNRRGIDPQQAMRQMGLA